MRAERSCKKGETLIRQATTTSALAAAREKYKNNTRGGDNRQTRKRFTLHQTGVASTASLTLTRRTVTHSAGLGRRAGLYQKNSSAR